MEFVAESIASKIDSLNKSIGKTVAWLTLGIVLLQFLVVVMRYIFGFGSIFIQEIIVYQHALIIMMGAGYTLYVDGHVRLDVFYRDADFRKKQIINIIGAAVFLLPMCIIIGVYSWPYVYQSWHVLEGSKETSGIPAVFMLKTCVLIFSVLLFLQGISIILRSWIRLLSKEYQHS